MERIKAERLHIILYCTIVIALKEKGGDRLKVYRLTVALFLAFVLVSVLSIAILSLARPLVQTYKTVEEMTILEASRTVNGVEDGMFTVSDNCAFGFSPKEGFLYVTKIVGNLYGYLEETGFHRYSVQINGMSWTGSPGIDQVGSNVMHSLFGCEDPRVLSNVKPGINMLNLDFMGHHAHIMKVVLLIEYEYQA